MGFNLAGLNDEAVGGAETEEEGVERVREGFWVAEENGCGFPDATNFEVAEDCSDH